MLIVLIRLPHQSGAWEIKGKTKEKFTENIEKFIAEYKQFLQDQQNGKYEHWENLESSSAGVYRSIGELRQEHDQMMANRPEFGLRQTSYDYLVEWEDALNKWGKPAQAVAA